MNEKKYHMYKQAKDDKHFYLELRDISEASIEIWQQPSGDKKTFVRIKLTNDDWEKILNERQHIQALQEVVKRVEI
tara:strand:- start:1131 stop:1358 length:228 start_codon:yes stop_codon:yes gene_type:complete